jgi:hypothetical protein
MTTHKESKIDEELHEGSLLPAIARNNNSNQENNSTVVDAIITTIEMKNTEQNAGQERNGNVDVHDHKIQELRQTTNSKETKLQDNSALESTEKATYFNPYAKLPSQSQPECQTLTNKAKKSEGEYPDICDGKDSNKHAGTDANATMPAKRNASSINIMNISPKKKAAISRNKDPVHLLVEGYAFHDDIIGVAHRKDDGGEAFNLVLRNMLFNKELEDDGFSAYVALRDKSSGKEDKLLTNKDGYPKFLFLSINVHHFNSANEAKDAVLQQCQKLQAVRTAGISQSCSITGFLTQIVQFPYSRLHPIQCTIFSVIHTNL